MPYRIIKNRGKNTYKVINAITGRIHAYATSLFNAKRQIRLMYLADN